MKCCDSVELALRVIKVRPWSADDVAAVPASHVVVDDAPALAERHTEEVSHLLGGDRLRGDVEDSQTRRPGPLHKGPGQIHIDELEPRLSVHRGVLVGTALEKVVHEVLAQTGAVQPREPHHRRLVEPLLDEGLEPGAVSAVCLWAVGGRKRGLVAAARWLVDVHRRDEHEMADAHRVQDLGQAPNVRPVGLRISVGLPLHCWEAGTDQQLGCRTAESLHVGTMYLDVEVDVPPQRGADEPGGTDERLQGGSLLRKAGMEYDRVVVGGGLFGLHSALVLAGRGLRVAVVERDHELMRRATYVNQARLHSGLHYPRSLLTARGTRLHYDKFKRAFPTAVREDFRQIYAVARRQSQTSAEAFARFVDRLDVDVRSVDPARWFVDDSVSLAVEVTEGTFDAPTVAAIIMKQVSDQPLITLMTGAQVDAGVAESDSVDLQLADGRRMHTGGVVIATYAGINPLRRALGLPMLPLKHELTEVVLCDVAEQVRGIGITVMDGPFFSFMPFGWTDMVSVTSVSLTPVRHAPDEPRFPCQSRAEANCSPGRLDYCTSCAARPSTLWPHYRQQMSRVLRDVAAFTYRDSLWTVKTVLSSTEVDDARPTFVQREPHTPVWTVFSGKINTIFDLDTELA